MSDLDLIRETYADLPDEKLIQVAKGDLRELAPGVYEILEKELLKRGLNINNYLVKEEPVQAQTEEPLPEFQLKPDSGDAALMGLSYQEMMYPSDPEKEKKEERSAQELIGSLNNAELERLMTKANWAMFLFAILFGIGLLVTLQSVLKPGEDRPVFAYGAIFSGLIGFFASWQRKKLYRSRIKLFEFEEEKKPDV